MSNFAEFESRLRVAIPQERADLQGLLGASEAQLSQWLEHVCREYLGYTHWKEITKESQITLGSKGSKQFFPDLRINIADNGFIFFECKKLGRFDGAKGPEEVTDATNQLKSYIRAFIDQASIKPKTVLGVVTDGNRWMLLGLNRTMDFHIIAEWTFLTDDPTLLTQRFWLLAKPALTQPTSALLEFMARRMLTEILQEDCKRLTKRVNEKLPEGSITSELVGRWIRDAFADSLSPTRLATTAVEAPVPPVVADNSVRQAPPATTVAVQKFVAAEPVVAAAEHALEVDGDADDDEAVPEAVAQSVMEQLKPLLGLLPEVAVKIGLRKTKLYIGPLVVGVISRKKDRLQSIRVYVGDTAPDGSLPDPKYQAWCRLDEWPSRLEQTAALLREAPTRLSADLALSRKPNRRRDVGSLPNPKDDS